MSPYKVFLDYEDNVYVNDRGTSLVVYNKDGIFKKLIRLKFSIPFNPVDSKNIFIDRQGYIYTFSWEITESGVKKALIKSDNQGNIIKRFAEFLETDINVKAKGGGGLIGGVTHPYSTDVFFCHVTGELLCFGENLDYKLFLSDLDGNTKIIFTKIEKPQSLTSEEKRILKRGVEVLPPHRPFFKGLLSDEKGRIYVIRTKSILDKDKIEKIDIFSKDGRYIYSTELPYLPKIIRNGNFYVIEKDEEEKTVIKKLIIKNYDKIYY